MINKEKSIKIKELVHEIVNKYDSNDPEEIVEVMEIKIYDTPITSKKESLSIIFDGCISIFINFKLNAERFYYRLAHELGHILLHSCDCNHGFSYHRKSHNNTKLDYEADYFAEKLLNYQNISMVQ